MKEAQRDMVGERADTFLRMIRRTQRGRLKVYLGYCPGVGKTYQMLQEGHRLKEGGIDVVIGLLETHGRDEIDRLAQGFGMVPRQRQEYRGIVVEEMDTDAILTRKPQVVLIDELAHTNVPGSRNPKRYQDIQDVLAAGIHVITTMNVQHLESLYNVVEKAIGVKVRERLPDSVLAEADQIVDVDLATEDLRKRLEDGKIYSSERIKTALANFFTQSNLEKLREFTLRELASQIDLRRRETSVGDDVVAPDQIMVCLSSRGPNSEKLLRFASRLAGKLNRNWYAVYVQTPQEEATMIDVQVQGFISDTLTLAKQLGAMVFTYRGEDIADTILKFAKEYRVGHIVIGKPVPKPFWRRFGKNKNIVGNLIKNARGVTMAILDTSEEESSTAELPTSVGETIPVMTVPAVVPRLALSTLLSPWRIVIWDNLVQQETVLRALASTVEMDNDIPHPGTLFTAIMKREEQGSTFFNEGVAFPHVRVSGLISPMIALGITKEGVLGSVTEKPVELVFLIISPEEVPEVQVQLLGLISRACQNRHFFRGLVSARKPEEAMETIRLWENPGK